MTNMKKMTMVPLLVPALFSEVPYGVVVLPLTLRQQLPPARLYLHLPLPSPINLRNHKRIIYPTLKYLLLGEPSQGHLPSTPIQPTTKQARWVSRL